MGWPGFIERNIKKKKSTSKLSRFAEGQDFKPARKQYRPILEILEDRVLLSVVAWKNPMNGDWDTPSNWIDGQGISRLPGLGDDVVIDYNAITVIHSIGADIVKSLATKATVDLTGGSLTIVGILTVGNDFRLSGGTLSGATVQNGPGGNGIQFTSAGGTLDGVTAASDLDLASNSGANVSVLDGLTLDNSTIYIGDAAGATYGQMYFDATESLGTVPGTTGTVVFGKNGSNALYETANPGGTLTLGAGITVRGSNGRLGGYYGGDGIVNLGTMSADDSGGIVPGYVYDTDFSGGNSWISATADTIDTSGVTAPARRRFIKRRGRDMASPTRSAV